MSSTETKKNYLRLDVGDGNQISIETTENQLNFIAKNYRGSTWGNPDPLKLFELLTWQESKDTDFKKVIGDFIAKIAPLAQKQQEENDKAKNRTKTLLGKYSTNGNSDQ